MIQYDTIGCNPIQCNVFRSAVLEPAKIQSILYPVLLVVGILLLLGAAIVLGISMKNKQQNKREYSMDMDTRSSKY